jgi:multidrug efflux system membrane fusion protein
MTPIPTTEAVSPGAAPGPHRVAARAARGIVFALLVTIAACQDPQKARAPRVPVTVATVMERPMPFSLISTGSIEPLQTSAIGSQVGGVVTSVSFREGDDVRKGQLLFQLDPRPFHAVLEQALAALARDRAQAESARLDAERAQKLFEQNMVAQAEWDQKRAAAEAWVGTVKSDSAEVRSARLNLEYSSIRAPIAGHSGRLLVHAGDYVKAASSDPLVTINQLRPVRVRFTVPESAVPMVQRYRGTHPEVVVRTSDGDSLSGRLVFVDNAVDPASGTLLLKGEIDNRDGRLVPGEFVQVHLVLFVEPRATVVPSPAVTNGQQGTFVYVMNHDSTVTPRPVAVERTVDEISVITHGLRPGETVITDGQFRLAPGARILVRKESKQLQ